MFSKLLHPLPIGGAHTKPVRFSSKRHFGSFLYPILAFLIVLYLILLLHLSSQLSRSVSSRLPIDRNPIIFFHPVRSNTNLFVTLGSYIVDDNYNNNLHLVILGVGDFTSHPQPRSDAEKGIAPLVPSNLLCRVSSNNNNDSVNVKATAHVNGTAYQGVVSKTRGALYFGERLLYITCPLPGMQTQVNLVRLLAEPHFDSMDTIPSYMVAPQIPEFNLTLCSSAIYGLTGSRWIIEYIEYHRLNGFDALDLYVFDVGELVKQVLDHYVKQNTGQFTVRIFRWDSVLNVFTVNEGVGHGVQSEAWEHGQRLTRNDCYLRNRGRSRWIVFSDMDELFSSPTGQKFGDIVHDYCEGEYQRNPNKIACSFSSVTVPPNGDKSIVVSDQSLFLERIVYSEPRCQSPYNCGRFHYGREKYALRTQYGSLNPNTPLFYHAISRDYVLAERHHVFVPSSVGVVRHYAGHFSHSRRGGLQHPKWNPLSSDLIQAMKRRIFAQDDTLHFLYAVEPQSENFLKLYALEDMWRFAKPGERPHHVMNLVNAKAVDSGRKLDNPIYTSRYLTFEYFGGRLNNQFWTLDWVFRLALALNRTAVLNHPVSREHFVGFPSSRTDASLWDLTTLKQAPFSFVFAHELSESDRNLLLSPPLEHNACTWRYSEQEKYVARWAFKHNHLGECTQRLHIESSNGLVHSYKADTRAYGVADYLVFWRHMRLHPDIVHMVQEWKRKHQASRSSSVGLHWRSWREAFGSEDHAEKVCKRLSHKIVLYANKHFQTTTCPCVLEKHDPWQLWRREKWEETTCKPASMERISSYVRPLPTEAFFVATDHETKEADQVFDALGAHMVSGLNAELAKMAGRFENRDMQRYAKSLLFILVDVQLMLEVDRFVGSPASTLSHAVCLWRRAMGKSEQVPGMCQFVGWSTYSDLCEELCYDTHTPRT